MEDFSNLIFGNDGLPEDKSSGLGKCDICPSYLFSSKTEKQRHFSIFHHNENYVQRKKKNPPNHRCTYITEDETKECGFLFSSKKKLQHHKRAMDHSTRRKCEADKTPRLPAKKKSRVQTLRSSSMQLNQALLELMMMQKKTKKKMNKDVKVRVIVKMKVTIKTKFAR